MSERDSDMAYLILIAGACDCTCGFCRELREEMHTIYTEEMGRKGIAPEPLEAALPKMRSKLLAAAGRQ